MNNNIGVSNEGAFQHSTQSLHQDIIQSRPRRLPFVFILSSSLPRRTEFATNNTAAFVMNNRKFNLSNQILLLLQKQIHWSLSVLVVVLTPFTFFAQEAPAPVGSLLTESLPYDVAVQGKPVSWEMVSDPTNPGGFISVGSWVSGVQDSLQTLSFTAESLLNLDLSDTESTSSSFMATSAYAGPDQSICPGQSTSLTATSSGAPTCCENVVSNIDLHAAPGATGGAVCAQPGWCRHWVNVTNNSDCEIDVWCDEMNCGSPQLFYMFTLVPGQTRAIEPSAYNAIIRVAIDNSWTKYF
ncbi:MAG: hypothetical protein AB8H12_06130, partial [Lewinella sp.]